MKKLTYIDILLTVISFVTFLADILSDFILAFQYVYHGYLQWAGLTLVFILVPSFITMMFSLRWYKTDGTISTVGMVIHALQGGVLYRYIHLVRCLWKRDQTSFEEDYFRQQSDVCLLRIFESFMESAPQLILQLYIMLSHENYTIWTSITAVTSVISLGWGVAAYIKAQRCSREDKKKLTIIGAVLQSIWRILMIAARIICVSLGATVLGSYIMLFLGVHFLCMFCWVSHQKTGFSKILWEEQLFNFVMAFVYCFCFFNLKEGQSRWRMSVFYTIILCENTSLMVTYYFLSSHFLWLRMCVVAVVVSCTIIGLLCMLLYYALWHPVGPLGWKTDKLPQREAATTEEEPTNREVVVKRCRTMKRAKSLSLPPKQPQTEEAPGMNSSALTTNSDPGFKKGEVMCSVQDLLENMSCLEDVDETVEVTDEPGIVLPESPDSDNGSLPAPHHVREKSLVRLSESDPQALYASPNKLGIPLVKTTCFADCDVDDRFDMADADMRYSSHSDVTVITVQDQSTFTSPMNSEQGNEVEEIVVNSTYIVEKEEEPRSNDYDNIYDAITPELDYHDQKPELPQRVPLIENLLATSSCPDYENIAPVNIFRAPMGIRHWKPYLDIEDKIHDYSTFKEKNRDFTLTSTHCSDYSTLRDTLCMSLPDLSIAKPFHYENKEYQYIPPPSPEKSNTQATPLTRFSSLDDLSNYEAIWVEADKKEIDSKASVVTPEKPSVPARESTRAGESLCNLYCSNSSELSLKRPTHDTLEKDLMKDLPEEPTKKSSFRRKKLTRVPSTPKSDSRCRRKFSILLERFEAQNWASLKSPVRRQISLHNRTAKALQAGMRVFHRPRVHTITPKKESKSSGKWTDHVLVKISPKVETPRVVNHFAAANELMPTVRKPSPEPSTEKLLLMPSLSTSPSRDNTECGPKHSTPESSRHLPQMSILSAVSSVVASPEACFEAEKASLRQISRELSGQASRPPFNDNFNYDSKRMLPKEFKSLTAIKELENRLTSPDGVDKLMPGTRSGFVEKTTQEPVTKTVSASTVFPSNTSRVILKRI